MNRKVKVLYYVQHLLGVGHVFRTMRIIDALTRSGFAVELIYGGERLPNFKADGAKVHFLPSLTSDKGDFSNLIDENGSTASDAYKADRRDRILRVLGDCDPEILITEAFPFGRRQMHFELLPLMEAVSERRERTKVFCSVRDILQEGNKVSKDRQTVDLLTRYFDGVLVHGDPDLIDLSATFPFAAEIAHMTYYTGIVTPHATGESLMDKDRFDVVVSVGGGMLGRDLVRAAAQAKAMTSLSSDRWCILTGPFMEDADRAGLDALGVEVRRFVPDLCATLKSAQLSISLAGYNTVADIMAAGCRAVIAPQWNDKETEQLKRAELLASRGLAVMLTHKDKTPGRISEAVNRAMSMPPPDWSQIRQNGADDTAQFLTRAVEQPSSSNKLP
ncbi:glycosyltransferase family protein [Hoeflea prorocentri]|uniref:Glycosyltransferase n=1 Tax=Hoeflea prorocentri TaxID=1922333 RepID=A0A9X3ZH18_9HYPH|nr:glycosyltransferase [Hoeflea prorocentri]MCY6380804.1 glycosyltransferase [Hoeflea prorocentri]MDA5398604.1 glycosyltransferase [Hoeflea prorocentri]